MNRQSTRIFAALFLLLFTTSALAQNVVRGPYLQQQTDGSIIVRWRTDVATDSVVRYGPDPTTLTSSASVGGSQTEHSVPVTGLSTLTQYYYSVGNAAGTLAGNDTYHFHTSPVIGTGTSTRFWAIGDSGTAVTHPGQAADVRDAFKIYSEAYPADFMMMLGDNAYNDGTDAQYQDAVFDTYPELLRQIPVWSTLGNHDGHSADSATQTGPYYDIFEFPTAGEIGGYPSGTEAYYSFDYGNVHFVCLDSYDSPRGVNGAMMTWLESDLAENDKPWVIAFWHHPPYSKGSHNSDSAGENRMTDMRVNFLPVLEAWGVDLVLTGHSHSYERSFLLDGHYGLSNTLDLSDPSIHVLDWGDGKEEGNGPYQKPGIVAAENQGAVYAVAGSSGKISGGSLDHPAMFVGLNSLGSMVVDVVGNRLDAVFIDETGLVRDEFTLLKSPDLDPPLIMDARAEDGTHVIVDFSERLDAASAGLASNYDVSGHIVSAASMIAGNRSVRLTIDPMTPGESNIVTVNNVMDEVGNTILPDSQFAFDFIPEVTVSFQDGLAPTPAYDGTSDSYIREATAGTNYGAAATLQVDGDEPSSSTNDMNIVIAWDVGEIPASATVISASIHLNTLNVGGPYSCYALLKAWSQDEVTWNDAAAGDPWGAPGAEAVTDRDNLALCTFNAGSTGPITIELNVDGIALLQSWVDDAGDNNGIIIADSVTSNGADFDSSESSTAMSRPKLEITYTVPVDPPNQPPTASFTDSCTDLDCSFTDTSTDTDGAITNWAWDFGDGNVSSAQNPNHSYAAGGSYTVSLTVTDDEGETDQVSSLVTVTAPNQPPTAAFNQSCVVLDCDFTDTSSDSDGSVVAWAWDFGDSGVSTAQNPSHSYTSDGSYTVELTVTDNEGATGVTSKLVTVSTPPLFTDVVASADIFGSGTVSGSYTATQTDDSTTQSIRERESGGKKQNRYSYLAHTWQADLPANAMATVYANAWSGGSSDDQFVFSWSTDNVNFTELFTVSSTDPANEQSAPLPVVVVGPLYIRVEDSDQTPGNRSLDTVFVDHLFVRAESGAGDPPAAPSALTATAAGSDQINLVWTDNALDESGFEIERSLDNVNFSLLTTTGVDVTGYSDSGLTASTTYWYRVRAWNASGQSAWSNTGSDTTDAPPPPPAAPSSLAAVSSGTSSIDLSWIDNSGDEQGFGIERSTDNVVFEPAGSTAANVMAFNDTGRSPGTTYWYRAYAFNAGGNSPYSNTDSATTDAGPDITLSLNGYKIKGKHTIDLSWSGTTLANVDIYRDGGLLETVTDTGAYTDATTNKGGRSYDYQVCEAGTMNCSDIVSVIF